MDPVDLVIEDPRWQPLDLEGIANRSARVTLQHLGLDPDRAELAVLACDDARIAVLNADFRGKPVPTNVLSWPAEDLAPDAAGGRPHPPRPGPDGRFDLGDIAIARETCAREAAEQDKTLENHVTHLLVHGLLHLLGYDHVEDADAEIMEGTEIEILGKMGLNDPYMG